MAASCFLMRLDALARLGFDQRDVPRLPRDDTHLVEVVRRLGDRAAKDDTLVKGSVQIVIVEVPEGRNWTIFEYDGVEAVVLDLPHPLTIVDLHGRRQLLIGECICARQLAASDGIAD